MDRPIPAFYACYLLRSTIRHASLYVGSTPNPVRRLRQHNGEAKGGAVRTSRDSLRPWEMTCLVTGFPSKIAALQFEWAWQNTNISRHISPSSRLKQAESTIRISPKTGRPRKRRATHRLSLSDRLANLHQLLRSSSFERWPLRVTFYAEDVFKVWQRWTAHVVGLEKSRPGIEIALDESSKATTAITVESGESAKGIHAINVGYSGLKPQLAKATDALSGTGHQCTICNKELSPSLALACPNEDCKAVGHVGCFASSFLKEDDEHVVPTTGTCLGCGEHLQWIDLVKELSLRIRGEEEVKKLFKVKKPRVANQKDATVASAAADVADDGSDDDEEIADDWHMLSESSEDEVEEGRTRSDPSPRSKPVEREAFASATRSEPVIEDSDWDDAEIVM